MRYKHYRNSNISPRMGIKTLQPNYIKTAGVVEQTKADVLVYKSIYSTTTSWIRRREKKCKHDDDDDDDDEILNIFKDYCVTQKQQHYVEKRIKSKIQIKSFAKEKHDYHHRGHTAIIQKKESIRKALRVSIVHKMVNNCNLSFHLLASWRFA